MHHCTQLRRRVGSHRRASEAPSAHPLYNSAVHFLCDAVAKATAEKGQLTLVSCFVEPHTPLSLQSVLILKREPSPEGPNAVFPSRQSSAPMPPTELLGSPWVPKFDAKTHLHIKVRTDAQKRCTCGPRGGPRCAKVTPKSPKWSQNGGPGPSQKWSCTRTALKTAQYAIGTLFAMFSSHRPLPKHLVFAIFLLPKSGEKQGAAPRSPKRPQK